VGIEVADLSFIFHDRAQKGGLIPRSSRGIDDERIVTRRGRKHDCRKARGLVLEDKLSCLVKRVILERGLRSKGEKVGDVIIEGESFTVKKKE